MIIQFKIIGTILILLAIVHIIFPKYFNWKTELQRLSPINRQMMQIHTLFIAITVFIMGILCLLCSDELIMTDFGNKICIGLALFWGIRLLIQFFGYSSHLWRGKKFETFVHILFSILWIYLFVVFMITGLGK